MDGPSYFNINWHNYVDVCKIRKKIGIRTYIVCFVYLITVGYEGAWTTGGVAETGAIPVYCTGCDCTDGTCSTKVIRAGLQSLQRCGKTDQRPQGIKPFLHKTNLQQTTSKIYWQKHEKSS